MTTARLAIWQMFVCLCRTGPASAQYGLRGRFTELPWCSPFTRGDEVSASSDIRQRLAAALARVLVADCRRDGQEDLRQLPRGSEANLDVSKPTDGLGRLDDES